MSKLLIPIAVLCITILGLSASATSTAQNVGAETAIVDTDSLEAGETAVGGARGGPEASLDSNNTPPILDMSQEAADSFQRTWLYEVQTPSDRDLPFEDVVYTSGIYACSLRMLRYPSPAVAAMLETNKGLSRTAAEAIVVSAQLNLCKRYSNNYTTSFDKSVAWFKSRMTAIYPATIQAGVTDYGYFMKTVCWHYMWENGNGNTVYSAVAPLRHANQLAWYLYMYEPSFDVRYLHLTIKNAVQAACPLSFEKLPQEVQSA